MIATRLTGRFGKRLALIAAMSITALSLACGDLKESPTDPGGGGEPPPDATATFVRVQQEILTPTCALSACHDPFFPQEALILSNGRSYALLVNIPSRQVPALDRVEPGDPDASYLYRKVNGGPGITGDRMPQGRPALTAAQLALLRDWIRRGAPND